MVWQVIMFGYFGGRLKAMLRQS